MNEFIGPDESLVLGLCQIQERPLSQSLPLFACFIGTLSPSFFLNVQPACHSRGIPHPAAMLRPGDGHNDQTDELVQSYPQLDVLDLLCPLVHAAVLIDGA